MLFEPQDLAAFTASVQSANGRQAVRWRGARGKGDLDAAHCGLGVKKEKCD
jgi:hypothetical protein